MPLWRSNHSQYKRSLSLDAPVSKNDSKESKSYRQPWREKSNPKYQIISIPNTPGWCDAGGYLGRSCWTCQAFQSPWFMEWKKESTGITGCLWSNKTKGKSDDVNNYSNRGRLLFSYPLCPIGPPVIWRKTQGPCLVLI